MAAEDRLYREMAAEDRLDGCLGARKGNGCLG
jgi:hypothetical protein